MTDSFIPSQSDQSDSRILDFVSKFKEGSLTKFYETIQTQPQVEPIPYLKLTTSPNMGKPIQHKRKAAQNGCIK